MSEGTMAERRRVGLTVEVEAARWLAGWRPEEGIVFVPALGAARVGDEVAARIGLAGQQVRATLVGTVSLVRRVGRPSLPPGIELVLEAPSLPAATFLAAAARGEALPWRERAPRYPLARALRITRDGLEREEPARNVSEGGCSVRWSGPMPVAGEALSVRVPGVFLPVRARAVVCWSSEDGPLARAVGLRVVATGRGARAWRDLVGAAAEEARAPA